MKQGAVPSDHTGQLPPGPDRRLRPGEFAKYHALGNDYLVLDGEVSPWPAGGAVRAWCNRHTGLGSDGLLLRLPPRQGGTAALRIFNPDGSEAEKSGNGLRIFARFLLDAGYAAGDVVHIELGAGLVEARLQIERARDAADSGPMSISSVAVDMGRPTLEYGAVGAPGGAGSSKQVTIDALGKPWSVTLVSMGNPHCVVFDAPLEVELLAELGPAIEHHPLFADRINVQLVRVVGRDRLELLIWERGAGVTQASGSSSCAAVAAAQARGLCGESVGVGMPGGDVLVMRERSGALWLSGGATPVARCCLWHAG